MRLIVGIRKLEAAAAAREQQGRRAVGICFDGSPRIDRSTLPPGKHVAVDIEMRCTALSPGRGRPPVFELRDSERITGDPLDLGEVLYLPPGDSLPFQVGSVVAVETTPVDGAGVVTIAYQATLYERWAEWWCMPPTGLPGYARCSQCGATVFSPARHECLQDRQISAV